MALAALGVPAQATGYSVLAHEANIDALWNTTIKAMLQARVPDATPEALSDARGYAYGGCVIQDLFQRGPGDRHVPACRRDDHSGPEGIHETPRVHL